ncbi:MAG: tetratricopeptide repeat protein [Nitrospirae bacterium]|nr:tetratricopeptide repeat protein [Nitrospirota bacterium]
MRRSMSYLLLLFIFIIVVGLTATQSFAQDNLQKGIAEYNAENYDESLQLFKEARREQPGSSTAAYYLGLAYEQVGQLDDAVVQYKDAISIKPSEKKAYTKLLEVVYVQNDLAGAKSYLAQAVEDGVSPADLSFLNGIAYLLENKNSDAIAAFNNAKELDTSLAQRANLYIGIAYARDNELDKASASLNAAVAIDPASELAFYAMEQQSALAGLMDKRQAWNFMLSAAVQYDDNLVIKPLMDIPGVADVSGEEDVSIAAIFDAKYRRKFDGPWFLNAGYKFYSNNYSESHTHNYLVQKLSVTPGYNLSAGNIFLPVELQHVFIDNKQYAYLVSINPTIKFIMDVGHIGEFSLGYLRRDMLDAPSSNADDRDGDVYSAGIGYQHPTHEGHGLFKAGYELSKDYTDGENWSNIGNRLNIGAIIPLKDKVDLTLTGDVFLQGYEKINDTKRRDRTYNGSANVKWQVKNDISLNFQYAHTRADSNVSLYDYRRNVYTTAVEYNF